MSEMNLPENRRLGDFEIAREIGRGGTWFQRHLGLAR
jgi:hypothetical protein